MKTLYVTDLDGTLLNKNEELSPFTINTINSLVERGINFTYATARSYKSAGHLTKKLNLKTPLIIYNGAFILNPQTLNNIDKNVFSKDEAAFLQKLCLSFNLQPLVYSLINGNERVAWKMGNEHYGLLRYLNSRKNDDRMAPLKTNDNLFSGEVYYVTCIGEKEGLQPLYNALKDDKRFNCVFQQELYRTEYWCEIMPKKATKANAIKTLKQKMGFSKIISFGDAINDIPMFEISDECYAVKNAAAKLKSLATQVIGSNEDDAVAKKLLELVNVKK